MATGRSDYPNQINNVLAFPGVMRGALSVRSEDINDEMKLAAARAISNLIKKPDTDNIIPQPFERGVAGEVAMSVAEAALETGVAGKQRDKKSLKEEIEKLTF